jgi:conjugal transfer pilin signal peptidase TrbI
MSTIITKRLSVGEYLRLCVIHFLRYWWQYTLPLAVIIVLQLFIRIDVNLTESLPDRVFVTVKGATSNIERGDYIAFKWPGGGPYPKGFHFVKIVAGVPGDVVRVDEERNFYIDKSEKRKTGEGISLTERHVGIAKTHSKHGMPLDVGPTGVIPSGHYYVYAPHPDSLDSRYALTGWIPQEAIIGKTYAIF